MGSPPHMRGKDFRVKGCPPDDGITPAYAGKSQSGLPFQRRCRDHPRVCGEKAVKPLLLYLVLGSPPRMRGKVVKCYIANCNQRITPAYAGKRKADGRKGHTQSGSPPRMRGKGPKGLIFIPQPRITPAYAGKSDLLWSRQTARGDHPRVCGEKPGLQADHRAAWGSPPRMRGKVRALLCSSPSPGITPAYAGKRRCTSACTLSYWDHPRVCGEKCW